MEYQNNTHKIDVSSSYNQVFENNRRWVKEMLADDPQYFENLAADHSPEFLYIGCSDSRVPANQIMGLPPGELFVHRNIANLVVNTDNNCQAVLQYAIESLGVKHIIVCGHYGCGGIHAAMQPKDMGLLNGWLREIRDVYRLHKDELSAIKDDEERHRSLVEWNVREQCVNIIKTAFLQKAYNEKGYPIVHGWVYDLHNGLLKDLEIDFEKTLDKVREIYDLRKERLINVGK
jgi:carbonic anhydrase